MFFLMFVLLTAVYTGIAVGIIILVAKYYDKPPKEYLGNNNTWFFVLAAATAITFLVALFNWGPAVLLPEDIPNPEQRATLTNFVSQMWDGTAAEPVTNPLPWTTGTWFWWKAWPLYFLLTFGYFFFAFSDEASYAWEKVREFVREEWEERKRRAATAPPPPPGGTTTATAGAHHRMSFMEFAQWDLVMEIVIKFATLFWEKFKTNRA